MKKISTRIVALFLTFCMVLGTMPLTTLAAESAATLTRADARDLMMDYAQDYNAAATAATVLRGYTDGTTKEDQSVLRIEALVMLVRAFGPFPAPDSYWTITSHSDITFTDVPAWAQTEIAALSAAGLLAPAQDGLLRPYEAMEREELRTMLRRVFSMFGTNLKDDFYATVNRTELNEFKIHDGMSSGGTFSDMQNETVNEITKLVETVAASTTVTGTAAHAIKAFYTTYLDTESRDTEGRAFMAPFLADVDKSTTIAQLEQVRQDFLKTTGIGLIGGSSIMPSEKDSNKYSSFYFLNSSTQGVDFYHAGDPAIQAAYRDYLTTVLTLSGDSAQDAAATASLYYDWETEISALELAPEQWHDSAMVYNYIPYTTLVEKLKTMNIAQDFSVMALKADDQIIVSELALLDAVAQLWTQENLTQAKAVLRVKIVEALSTALGEDYFQAQMELERIQHGLTNVSSLNRRAITEMQYYLSDALGQLYAEATFSTQSKTDVTTMTENLLDTYATRIDKLDWMSDATKTMAKKKLETMEVNMGYPDQWDTTFHTVDFKTAADGGTFIENICKYYEADNNAISAAQSKPVDKEAWLMAVYHVNAYYYPTANSINFPAAILQTPFYDLDASLAANLGGIGAVICHEISHAFDDSGAQYDELGNLTDWWTEADYSAFSLRCKSVDDFFHGWESAPGVAMSGTRTLSENLADIAGVSAALDLLESTEENPDYVAFFTNYAKVFQRITGPAYAQTLSNLDVHAATSLRINRVVVHFQQFYDAFGITEDDAMYVAPADRISIW